jgi:DNA-binding CsgD family transcriptional regulator
MTNCVDEFIDVSILLSSTSELLDLYLKAVDSEGFQNAVCARARDQRLVSIEWDRLPAGYLSDYQAFEWDKIDPIVQHIHSARAPFHWAELCARPGVTPRQRWFLEECRERGIHSGVTIPLHGPGTEVDLISLSMRDQKRTSNGRLDQIYAITVQYWLRFSELSKTGLGSVPHLTAKEIESLRWCKEGKTNWEIGEIMRTSEKTIEFHVSNAIRKLGACNRITAVVMAIKTGIISL